MPGFFLTLPVLLAAYLRDETVSGYALRDTDYMLSEIDGAAPPARATIAFPGRGRITGEGPCNRYAAVQTAPYPWFVLDELSSTKRACAELEFEHTYLTALGEMTLAEAMGPVLILSNDAGREMVFRADQD
jgi:heat shock protein HslJ